MRKRTLYFIRSAYNVFIRSHILDFAHAHPRGSPSDIPRAESIKVFAVGWQKSLPSKYKGERNVKILSQKKLLFLARTFLPLPHRCVHPIALDAIAVPCNIHNIRIFSFSGCITESTCWNWNSSIAPIWTFSIMFDAFNLCPKRYEQTDILKSIWNLFFLSTKI